MRALPLSLLSLLTLALGCQPLSNGRGADGTPDDPNAEEPVEDPTPAENPFGDAESCAEFATGTVTMDVGGDARVLEVELPADPEGAPVVFAWHWLGGTASQTLDWMAVRDLADEGYIVVAPESSGLQLEWDFNNPGTDNVDLALFDAVLSCLWEDFGVDDDRVYSTGMSAGGLMTTFLTMHRADVLAATAPFSGGAFEASYREPEADIPVLVSWGGPSDTYGGYDFHGASLEFLDLLDDDGHFTVACEHTGGHLPPAEAVDMMSRFFADHVRGAGSPWASDGLPQDLPAWCE